MSICGTISLGLHEAKGEDVSPRALCLRPCSAVPFPVGIIRNRQAGVCRDIQRKASSLTRLAAIGWAPMENTVGTTSRDSISTFIVGVRTACSLRYEDFACGVFYWWWQNTSEAHC